MKKFLIFILLLTVTFGFSTTTEKTLFTISATNAEIKESPKSFYQYKKPRKTRSDKGKKRGSYRKRRY
jgi:hypothetical protein